jgi:hypothetical protein
VNNLCWADLLPTVLAAHWLHRNRFPACLLFILTSEEELASGFNCVGVGLTRFKISRVLNIESLDKKDLGRQVPRIFELIIETASQPQ